MLVEIYEQGLIQRDLISENYRRYLSTCVRAFDQHFASDVQLKLRRID